MTRSETDGARASRAKRLDTVEAVHRHTHTARTAPCGPKARTYLLWDGGMGAKAGALEVTGVLGLSV